MPTFGESELSLVADRPGAWLSGYAQSLGRTSLGQVAREVVLDDAAYIADRAVPPVTSPEWDSSRTRTGVVMGAVQSGKTASMLGVTARALDNGTNVVVILAGTQTALWRQSFDRIQTQLDVLPGRASKRLFLPNPRLAEDGGHFPGPADLYSLTESACASALRRGSPIIVVAMKEVHHLERVGHLLHGTVYPAARRLNLDLRVLVIDDEADDSSIADGVDTSGADPKQVPRRILDLWEPRQAPGKTVDERTFAAYVAYTATPQSNFLQDQTNPLAPRHFVASLRTPGPNGDPSHRSLTYAVPEGLPGWYTGADLFYRSLVDTICVVDTPADGEGALAEATEESTPSTRGTEDFEGADLDHVVNSLRAYLTAAAIRLCRSPGRIRPASGAARLFEERDDAVAQLSSPTCMLVHPSSSMADHFLVADALRRWWTGTLAEAAPSASPFAGVLADLDENESMWLAWIESYRISAATVQERFSGASERPVSSWAELREVIVEELLPATTIAVINSDPDADEKPAFEPWWTGEAWAAPRNSSTVFVSGNVMSRGLTLEGLLTTVFTRASKNPYADTQMQMQRWFGYRGSYLDLCRVFLSPLQLDLFTQYGDADDALRTQIIAAMNANTATLPTISVLQGAAFQATGKVSIRGRPLSPGKRPFVRHLNSPGKDHANIAILSEFFDAARTRGELVSSERGLLVSRPVTLVQTAQLLEQLRYDDHGWSPEDATRWRAIERQAGILDTDPAIPLYRAPAIHSESVDLGSLSPYYIAAYLRLWSTALERNIPGLYTNDLPAQRWSLLDLEEKQRSQPLFYVGLRFGSGSPVKYGPLANLAQKVGRSFHAMARASTESVLSATWGSRGATESGYRSDDLFDVQMLDGHTVRLNADGSRATGTNGLALFHLVERGGAQEGIALGLSIPSGGPDHIEAVSTRMSVAR
ncbi:Z1 domain-containing protein [Occultella kanbiaonis]|uniref:Z1 domain-containing protein n=1 Tax=Occultella kanbiaonis TaxID=2675754 RepID=UPI00143DF28D|nr:Z1 domain-containing protein [Occultella kanbiaonis]